jgi:hypothetical protein
MKSATAKSKESGHSSNTPLNKKGKDSFFGNKESDKPFFQPKIKIGSPKDKYEREADKVADKVVSEKENKQQNPIVPIQRQKDEEKKVQEKAIAETISPIGQTKTEGELLQGKPAFESSTEYDQNTEKQSTIQRSESDGADSKSSVTDSDFSNQLNNSRNNGHPLPSQTRHEMEEGIGADFDNVSVHTGKDAVQMNHNLNSKAFASGSDIYFNEGKFSPGTKEGDHLLAHELTHTIQQGASESVKQKSNNSSETDLIQKQEPGSQDGENKKVSVKTKKTINGSDVDIDQLLKNKPEKEELPTFEEKVGQEKSTPPTGEKEEGKKEEKQKKDIGKDSEQTPVSTPITNQTEQENAECSAELSSHIFNQTSYLPEPEKQSEEFKIFKGQILTQRSILIEKSQSISKKIELRNEQEKAKVKESFLNEEIHSDQLHLNRLTTIKDTVALQVTNINNAQIKQTEDVNKAAEAEKGLLFVENITKRDALLQKATEYSNKAKNAGNDVQKEIETAATDVKSKMAIIGLAKGAKYKNYDRASRIKSMAFEKVDQRSKEVDQMVEQLEDIEKPLNELAEEITDGANKNVGKLDEGYEKAVEEVEKQRKNTIEEINKATKSSIKQLNESKEALISALEAQRKGDKKKLKASLKILLVQMDQMTLMSNKRMVEQTDLALQKIDAFLIQVTQKYSTAEGESAKKAFIEAENEFVGMVDAFLNDLSLFSTTTQDSIAQTGDTTSKDVKQKQSTSSGGMNGTVAIIVQKLNECGAQSVQQIMTIALQGKDNFKQVTKSYSEKSAEAIQKQVDGWVKAINETKAEIEKEVRPKINEIKNKSDGLGAEIDKEAERIENESWWERVVNFALGIARGFVLAIIDLVAFIFSSLLIAIIAIVLIVVIIILVIKFAIVGLVLLIIGIVVAVVMIGINIYMAITRDDLSDQQRGEYIGRAVFEGATIYMPVKHLKFFKVLQILKRVKGLKNVDPVKLSKLIKAMGSMDEVEELLKVTKDVAVAERLWKQVGDLAKIKGLVQAAGGNAAKAEKLLKSFKDTENVIEALEFYKSADRVELLLKKLSAKDILKLKDWKVFKNASSSQIDTLFNSRKIQGDEILSLLRHPDLGSLSELNTCLAHAKIKKGSDILYLLNNTKFKAPTIHKALDSPLITNLDELVKVDRLSRSIKKGLTADNLVKLLNSPLVKSLDDLELAFASSKIKNGQHILDALATGKLKNLSELNALLGSDKVKRMADLLAVLKNDSVRDIHQLQKVMALDDVNDILQFRKLLDKRVINSVDDLDEVLAQGKLMELLEAANLAKIIPGIKGGEFAKWFNKLSEKELAKLMSNAANKKAIGDRLRNPRGKHEWLMVSKAPKIRKWGLTAEDVWKMRDGTGDINLNPNKYKVTTHDSGKFHIDLAKMIDDSNSFKEFRDTIRIWADESLVGGRAKLPEGLR